jgi:uncharacterized protein YkwD
MEAGTMAVRSRLGRLATLVVLTSLFLGLLSSGARAGSADGMYRDRWHMLKATNGSRFNNSITRVNLNKEMSELARLHSVKMARAGDLFHTSNPSSYYLRNMRWRSWGENVGVTGGTIIDLQRAFMASSGHRRNVLDRNFKNVAIGAVRRDGMLWVTVFFYS